MTFSFRFPAEPLPVPPEENPEPREEMTETEYAAPSTGLSTLTSAPSADEQKLSTTTEQEQEEVLYPTNFLLLCLTRCYVLTLLLINVLLVPFETKRKIKKDHVG